MYWNVRNDELQKQLQNNAGAASTRSTAKSYEKSFLTFLGANVEEGIKVEHLVSLLTKIVAITYAQFGALNLSLDHL